MQRATAIEHLFHSDPENHTCGFDNGRLEAICNGRLKAENTVISEHFMRDSIEGRDLSKSTTEQIEIITDVEMINEASDYLETIDTLNYKEWSKLTIPERLTVLNYVENGLAQIEHRPALNVQFKDLDIKCFGFHCDSERLIVLNSKYVGANDPLIHREIIDTIIHEGRHAYQHYNVDVKCIHESLSEVKEWEKNFYDPQWRYYSYKGQKIYIPFDDGETVDVGYRLYANQPVEIDARNFASEVLRKLESKGAVVSVT